jgi:hypothetical protein
MERFPLEYKVEWETYNKSTYDYMFINVLGKSYPELSFLLEKLHKNGTTISPRTAIKAAKILDSNDGDFSCLDYIADFSGKNATLTQTELAKFKNVKIVEDLIELIEKDIEKCKLIDVTRDVTEIKKARVLIKTIESNITSLASKKLDDDYVRIVSDRIKHFNQFISQKLKEIKDATE